MLKLLKEKQGGHRMKACNKIFFIQLIIIIILLICMLFNGCSSKPKIYHIGILSGLDFFSGIIDGFKEKMTELGYIEGKNITYEIYKAPAPVGNENAIKKFLDEKVDLIVSFPTEASIEAKSVAQGSGIPILFVNVFTEDTGLVNSIREPGGNITGVRWPGPDMALRRFEIMCELVPQAKQMIIPYMKNYPIVKSQLEVLRQAFKTAGLKMIEIPAKNAAEIESALKKQTQLSNIPDAVLCITEPLAIMKDSFLVIAKFAAKHKIPLGGAMSFGGYETIYQYLPQSVPQGRQAAFLADKIFKGTPAGTIPVVSAECFLTINYRAAKKLGLKIPEDLLNLANEIIR